MTYQPPYQPPGNYGAFDCYAPQPPDFLAPARRAANLLFVLGSLAIVSSFCCIGGSVMLPQLMDNPDFAAQMQGMPGLTVEMIRTGFIVLGVASVLLGVAYIVLGIFVRRGSKAAIITSMVLSILAALFLLIQIIPPFFTGAASAQTAMGACMLTVPLALVVLSIVWLIGAMRGADQEAKQRYAMEYWRGQQKYGYPPGSQQPPPPPAESGGPPEEPRDRTPPFPPFPPRT